MAKARGFGAYGSKGDVESHSEIMSTQEHKIPSQADRKKEKGLHMLHRGLDDDHKNHNSKNNKQITTIMLIAVMLHRKIMCTQLTSTGGN